MKIAVTNPNKRNRLTGARVRIYSRDGGLVYQTTLPAGNARRYLANHAASSPAATLRQGLRVTAGTDAALAYNEARRAGRPECAATLLALFAEGKARASAERFLAGLPGPVWGRA